MFDEFVPPDIAHRRLKKSNGETPGKHDRYLARRHYNNALNVIISIMNDDEEKPVLRLAAAKDIADRAYGKAPQMIHTTEHKENTPEHMPTNDLHEKIRELEGKMALGMAEQIEEGELIEHG